MKKEEPHLATLSKHKHIYDFYMRAQEMVGFHPHIQNEVFDAYRVVDPHFHYNSSCPICVCEALVKVYNWYENNIA